MELKNIFPESKIKEFKKLIDRSSNIVVTCHVRPDGDAIGSSLGWSHALTAMGKNVTVILPDRLPRNLEFLPGAKDAAVFTQHADYIRRVLKETDLILMCDFNTPERQGDLAPLIQGCPATKVLIDHHKGPDIDCRLIFSYPEMSSTCELSFRLMAAMGWYTDLNLDCCTALMTGLITDTRNLTVNCDHEATYIVFMKLLEKNVDKKTILEEALNSTTLNALKLNCYAVSDKMEVYASHRCALITLDADELTRFNYQKGDTEGLVNTPLEVRGMVYSCFMRQDPDCVKVSMRSKYNFPVDMICREHFNGGGHQMAAGGEFMGTLAECRKIFLDNMADYDKYLPSNLTKLELK